ncbi:MAG: ATP-binding cassette domain-containing protein, partial [Rhodobacteraceae bacterium]|nr:ATP-binding cassette domain-containing protein [Paracoccaceae bacterium]
MHLAVQDLGVARGGFAVLEGLTFRVEAGTSLILRGPNGIGKTTLLRAIAGLQPPLNGSIDAPEDSIAYAA